jgi:hypothetical protein
MGDAGDRFIGHECEVSAVSAITDWYYPPANLQSVTATPGNAFGGLHGFATALLAQTHECLQTNSDLAGASLESAATLLSFTSFHFSRLLRFFYG